MKGVFPKEIYNLILCRLDKHGDWFRVSLVCKLFYNIMKGVIDINSPNAYGFNAVGYSILSKNTERLLIHLSNPKFKLDMANPLDFHIHDGIMIYIRRYVTAIHTQLRTAQYVAEIDGQPGPRTSKSFPFLESLLDNEGIHELAKHGLPLLLIAYLKTRDIDLIRKLLTMFPCRPLLARFFVNKSDYEDTIKDIVECHLPLLGSAYLAHLFCGTPVTKASYAELNKKYPNYKNSDMKPWLTYRELVTFSKGSFYEVPCPEDDSHDVSYSKTTNFSFRKLSTGLVKCKTSDNEVGWISGFESQMMMQLLDRSVFHHSFEIIKAIFLKLIELAEKYYDSIVSNHNIGSLVHQHYLYGAVCSKHDCQLAKTMFPLLQEITEEQKRRLAKLVLGNPRNPETLEFVLKWIGNKSKLSAEWKSDYTNGTDGEKFSLLLDLLIDNINPSTAIQKDDTSKSSSEKKHERQNEDKPKKKKTKKQKTK